MSNDSKRNIVFIGETGTGKSSAINLLMNGASAPISNDSQPCTPAGRCYETTLYGMKYNLWDTRGLGEGRTFLQAFLGARSEKNLKKFLKERHWGHEIDLLVYCVRGSRATEAARDYYRKFCIITRKLAAPVVVVVTHLEMEGEMEDWWGRNSSRLEELGMGFDGHACITTLANHPLLAVSREKLIGLITQCRRWEPKGSGSYFGSPVQTKSTADKGLLSRIFGSRDSRRPSNYPADSTPSNLTENTSYHTAATNSLAESTVPSPVVEPPTPRSAPASIKVPQINTSQLGAHGQPQLLSEETLSSMGSSVSIFRPSSGSSRTSYSEVYLESCAEGNGDSPTDLPFRVSTSTVRRRKNWPSHNGAFGDVWECDLISEDSSRIVAVKAVRINANGSGSEDLKAHERKLRRELKVWGILRHRNIVPLLGVVSGFGPLPSTVSPWFCRGSLFCYLAQHQALRFEKHRLLGDIAVGLCYLHSQDVIHGDLHSGNVLIDDDGTACITDFGLSFMSDFVGTSYLKSGICGGVHFADPALVKRAYSSQEVIFYPTKPCDIYSFGGLMLHVLSGKKPYDGIRSPTHLFAKVLKGERPQIPTHDEDITDWHKSLIRLCWTHEERKRPSADDLVWRFDRQSR